MKYENARDILPKELYEELQKLAPGKLLYVPSRSARCPWGDRTGYRRQLAERNGDIRRKFTEGASIDSLADEYFLTPETVKKIVYLKKERNNMDISEIARFYSNDAPTDVGIAREYDNGFVYYVKAEAAYPDRKIDLHICDYDFGTKKRVAQAAKTAEEYRAAGFDCVGIVPDIYGEIARDVIYNGRACVVYATEHPGSVTISSVRGNVGLPLCGEILSVAAKIASLGLESGEVSAFELFESVTAGEASEDYTLEYNEIDLKKEVLENYPALAEKFARIEELFRADRDVLRAVWKSLPSSVSFGELYDDVGFSADGHLKEFRSLIEGGRETNLGFLFRVLFALIDETTDDGEGNNCAEMYDADLLSRRKDAFRSGLKYIAERYRFSEDEIALAPYVYRVRLLGSHYYWEIGDFAAGDEKRLSDFFDFLEKRLTTDEIDFEKIMR